MLCGGARIGVGEFVAGSRGSLELATEQVVERTMELVANDFEADQRGC